MWILKENSLKEHLKQTKETENTGRKDFHTDVTGIKFLLNSISMPFVQ